VEASDDAPGSGALFADLWRRAGLPAGVLGIVHGAGGGSAGEYLVEMVDAGLLDVVLRASTAVGGRSARFRTQFADSVARAGRQNPLVILADADIELAVDGALWASFGTAGQRCTSAGNIIVDKRVLPTVRDQLQQRAKALRIGNPLDEHVDYGPFINERFLERWIEQRGIGLDDGAELLVDGRRITPGDEPASFAGDAARCLYGTPRIFDRVKMTMRVAREECFGPTVNLVEVDGLDEAIAAANGTPYGLTSAIYTRDAKAMLRFKAEISAGMTSINNSTTGAEAHLPFGGNGWSGNGTRERGIWVLDSYALASRQRRPQREAAESADRPSRRQRRSRRIGRRSCRADLPRCSGVARRHATQGAPRPYIGNLRWFRMPKAACDWHALCKRILSSAMAHAVVPSRRGERRASVLVAEDDRDLRRIVSVALAYDGYEVIEVADGDALLAYLASNPAPEVIVSDVCMPHCSGLDALVQLRELGVHSPVVLMTAFPDHCSEAGARELGAVTLVEKPFELDDLRMIVMNILPPHSRVRAQQQQAAPH
jgi:CheY-like chemotaxis protein